MGAVALFVQVKVYALHVGNEALLGPHSEVLFMARSLAVRFGVFALTAALAGCGSAPEAAGDDVDVEVNAEELGGSVLDLTTVSQGGRGSVHAHNCYLAACTTVMNYLTGSRTSMDEAWARIGKASPATDRIRTTFTRLGLPSNLGYMAAVRYSASPTQLKAIGTSIANGWPVVLGIGPQGTSAASIGHYIVLGGVDSTANPTKFVLHDPWNAPANDRGVMVPAPSAGAPVTGLRASRSWVALEVYFAKNYKTKRTP